MLIQPRPLTDAELTALVTAQQRELRAADGGLPGQATVVHGDARYLVGVVDGHAVACGAIQVIAPGVAEIKRMYVRPTHRGRQLARRMLAALEELAARSGCGVLRLETATYLPAAIRLYASSGYGEIPAYGEYVDNPYSVCFEKRLPAAVS